MHAKWDWQYPVAWSWIRCTQFVASSYQWQTLRGSIQIRYVHPRISWKHRRKRKWQGERRTKDNTDSSHRLIFVWFVWPKAICRSFLLLLCHLFRFMLPCERRTLFSLHNYCLAFYVHNTHFSCVFFFNFFFLSFFPSKFLLSQRNIHWKCDNETFFFRLSSDAHKWKNIHLFLLLYSKNLWNGFCGVLHPKEKNVNWEAIDGFSYK